MKVNRSVLYVIHNDELIIVVAVCGFSFPKLLSFIPQFRVLFACLSWHNLFTEWRSHH